MGQWLKIIHGHGYKEGKPSFCLSKVDNLLTIWYNKVEDINEVNIYDFR